jgi:hypothetical protein
MEFNARENIPATFFFGVSNGCNLSYSLANAAVWIRKVAGNGFDVGVHGIEFQNFDEIKQEYLSFREILGNGNFGIRMHYLRQVDNTFTWLGKSGYLFDSTLRATEEYHSPFRIDNMWEFPLHIMDGDILEHGSRYASTALSRAKELTMQIIDKYDTLNTKYLTVLFHDRYFHDSFLTWRDWYIWIISYLKDSGFEFINYPAAIKELTVS